MIQPAAMTTGENKNDSASSELKQDKSTQPEIPGSANHKPSSEISSTNATVETKGIGMDSMSKRMARLISEYAKSVEEIRKYKK